jgi:hypothetical protein
MDKNSDTLGLEPTGFCFEGGRDDRFAIPLERFCKILQNITI